MGLIAITGKSIEEFRKKKNWTQQHLALLMGIDTATVNRWESVGDKEAPVRSAMYSILLPLLAGAHIELELSEEGRKEVMRGKKIDSDLVQKALNAIPWPMSSSAAGWVMNPTVLDYASKFVGLIRGLTGFLTTSGDQRKLMSTVKRAILVKELFGMQPLFLEMTEAWKEIAGSLLEKAEKSPDGQ